MSQIRNEVLKANDTYAQAFGDKGALAMPPARRSAIPDVHGRASRSSEICQSRRGRRTCDPQCRRPGQRRCHSGRW